MELHNLVSTMSGCRLIKTAKCDKEGKSHEGAQDMGRWSRSPRCDLGNVIREAWPTNEEQEAMSTKLGFQDRSSVS